MKIILPVHHFPPRYSAGAELYTFRLARWLIKHGHDAEVVCIESIDQGIPGELQVVQDSYQGITVWRLAFNLIDAPERQRWNYDNPLIGAWFGGYLKRTRPDIVHFQAGYLLGIAPLEAAHHLGVASVLTLHDYWFLCPRITLLQGDGTLCTTIPENPAGCAWCILQEQQRYQVADRMSGGLVASIAQGLLLRDESAVIAERRKRLLAALALPDAVIAPSHFLAKQFAPFIQPERMQVSRYGLDLGSFPVQPAHTDTDALRIGYVGQIAPHKGVHLLIEAFGKLNPQRRSLELHIYGGLDAQPHYTKRIRNLGLGDTRINWHGRFEHQRIAEILSTLDVVVVPSTWYENSPLAIMEAQAAGIPVVTSSLGGMAELVRDGLDGLHFQAANSHDLARQLQRLIDEPDLLPLLRSNIAKPRTIDNEMETLLAIYQRVLAQCSQMCQEVR